MEAAFLDFNSRFLVGAVIRIPDRVFAILKFRVEMHGLEREVVPDRSTKVNRNKLSSIRHHFEKPSAIIYISYFLTVV